MSYFSNLIGDVPGDPAEVARYAREVRAAGENAAEAYGDLRHSERSVPDWQGASANAFQSAMSEQKSAVTRLQDGLYKAASSLENYGYIVAEFKRLAANVQGELEKLDAQLSGVASWQEATTYMALSPQVALLVDDYNRYLTSLEEAADQCGAELRNALDIEPVNYNDDGVEIGSQRSLTERDMERINNQLKDMAPEDINQRGIGDCTYLAGLGSVMQYPEGQEWLASCITPHYDASGKQDGYLVTLYDDPLHPDDDAKQQVLVTDVYTRGVKGSNGPSVVSVFESAYGQLHPGGTLGGPDGISGNSGTEVFKDITGLEATSVLGMGREYDSEKRAAIIEASRNHQPAIASTTVVPDGTFDSEGHATVTASLPDGSQQEIFLNGSHAYTVVSADASGVTLRNPWGHNDTPSDNPVDGTFHLSWDTFSQYYGQVDIGTIP